MSIGRIKIRRSGLCFLIICMILPFFFMAGCAGKDTGSKIPEDNPGASWVRDGVGVSDHFYILKGNGQMLICDKATGECSPLCFRASCEHRPYVPLEEASDCPAAMLYRDASNVVGYWHGHYYYVRDTSSSLSTAEGTLMRVDPDGENAVHIANVPVTMLSIFTDSVFSNGKLYTVGLEYIFPTSIEDQPKMRHRLLEIDLYTGDTIILKEAISEKPIAFRIQDLVDDVLYVLENQKDSLTFYGLNLKTRTEVVLPVDLTGLYKFEMLHGHIVYSVSENDLYTCKEYDLRTGLQTDLLFEVEPHHSFYLLEDKGLILTAEGCYELLYDTLSVTKISDITQPLIGSLKDGVLIRDADKYGVLTYYYASWSDYKNGNTTRVIYDFQAESPSFSIG